MLMPFQVLGIWVRGLLGVGILILGIYALRQWYEGREYVAVGSQPTANASEIDKSNGSTITPIKRNALEHRRVGWSWGFNRETGLLLAGTIALAYSLGGGWIYNFVRHSHALDSAAQPQPWEKVSTLQRPDGCILHIAEYGPNDAPRLIFTHGWGLHSEEWRYAKRELGNRFRLIAWDLPGLGKSTRPQDRDWSLTKLAGHLDAIIANVGKQPVVLVGHSIGTMITLTFCKLFPESLGNRVSEIILTHGTYTNPVHTTSHARLKEVLQKPLLEPLCHLMIWTSPLLWLMNWISYFNGSAHRSVERDSFSGHESWSQLNFITRSYCAASPAVMGRGMLAMFRYDATDILSRIRVPTLVITGDRDRTCLPEASAYMAKAIPNSQLTVLADAKHCGLYEHHEQFHETILDFLVAHGKSESPSTETLPPIQLVN